MITLDETLQDEDALHTDDGFISYQVAHYSSRDPPNSFFALESREDPKMRMKAYYPGDLGRKIVRHFLEVREKLAARGVEVNNLYIENIGENNEMMMKQIEGKNFVYKQEQLSPTDLYIVEDIVRQHLGIREHIEEDERI